MARLNNIRINESTGKQEFYFPMEITSENKDMCRTSSNLSGYEIGEALLGNRVFKALFIPVSEEQYRTFTKDELNEQQKQKQESRCLIRGKNGKLIRCPMRKPNPSYIEGGVELKTLAIKCECCPHFNKKRSSRVLIFSDLIQNTEEGIELLFDPVNPYDYFSEYEYESLMDEFKRYINLNKPKLLKLVTLLLEGYSQTEVAELLGKSTSTINSQVAVIKQLYNKLYSI